MAPIASAIPDSQDALAWAVTTANDTARAKQYAHYHAYYDGDHDLQFATPKFKQAFGQLFEVFAYNRCAVVCDTIADRLAVERFSVVGSETPLPDKLPTSDGADSAAPDAPAAPAAPEKPSPGKALEQQADAIWTRNSMQRREREVYIEAFTCGDAYVLVWPDPESGKSIIWPQPAHSCSVRYSDEQPDRIILGTKRWRESQAEKSRIRLNVYFPDRIERHVTRDTYSRTSAAKFRPDAFVPFTDDEAGEVVPNPWDTVPLFHFANKGRTGALGVSELRDIIPINDALNKTLADMMIAEEFSAFVQKVIIGVDADPQVEGGVIQNPTGAFNAEMMRRLATGADRIITLGDVSAKIAEWSTTALDQFQEVAEGWDARISRVSKIPVHYLTLSSDFPSGRALRAAEAPFIPKIEADQRDFGEVWEDVEILALQQDGVKLPEDIRESLSVVWRSAAPLAEEDRWDLVLQMTTTGVPLPVALKRIGWTEAEIAELETLRQQRAKEDAQREITMLTAGQMAGDEEVA